MANDQNKYIKQTFDCIPIIEALYSYQSKYYLYIIYHPCDEVWSGKESLTLYDHLPRKSYPPLMDQLTERGIIGWLWGDIEN